MDFLGFRFHPGWIGLSRRSRRRLKLKIRSYEGAWAVGEITEEGVCQRATAALGFVRPACCHWIRRQLMTESIYE